MAGQHIYLSRVAISLTRSTNCNFAAGSLHILPVVTCSAIQGLCSMIAVVSWKLHVVQLSVNHNCTF
jgi:hypothetical protein